MKTTAHKYNITNRMTKKNYEQKVNMNVAIIAITIGDRSGEFIYTFFVSKMCTKYGWYDYVAAFLVWW